jgi:hypothetical protein
VKVDDVAARNLQEIRLILAVFEPASAISGPVYGLPSTA